MNRRRLILLFTISVIALITALFGVIMLTKDNAANDNINQPSPPSISPPVPTNPNPQETQVVPPSGDIQTIAGEIICLPKPGNGPQTMECAIGMKAENQKNYALKNNPKYDIPIGTKVVVTGTFAPPETNTRYDIVGTIDVKTIEETQ